MTLSVSSTATPDNQMESSNRDSIVVEEQLNTEGQQPTVSSTATPDNQMESSKSDSIVAEEQLNTEGQQPSVSSTATSDNQMESSKSDNIVVEEQFNTEGQQPSVSSTATPDNQMESSKSDSIVAEEQLNTEGQQPEKGQQPSVSSTATPDNQMESSNNDSIVVEEQLNIEGQQPENVFVSPGTTTPGILTHFDQSVLPLLGGFRKYQKQLILLTWIPLLFIGAIQHSDKFHLDQPNITCVQPMLNLTNHTAAPSALLDSPRNMDAYGTYRDVNNMQCSCTEWKFTLYTGLVENVVTKWSLVCDSEWEIDIAKFALCFGSIFGYLVFGILSDWFGRKPALITSALFMLTSGLSVAFSVSILMFSILRFFEGFSLAGIILSLYLLRIELCPPKQSFSVTMGASFLMLVGRLLLSLVVSFSHDWRMLQILIICPIMLILFYIWMFPESLRWLLATQQYSHSKRVMEHIAKKNNVNVEADPDNVFAELEKAFHIKPKKFIVIMVRTSRLWTNIAVLCFSSMTGFGIQNSFVYTMMIQEEQHTTMSRTFYKSSNIVLFITFLSCLTLCPLVRMMGQRLSFFMFMLFTALTSLLQLGIPTFMWEVGDQMKIENADMLNNYGLLASSIIGLFSSYAVSHLSIFICAELTPTAVRGGSLGLVLSSAGVGMLTGTIVDISNHAHFLYQFMFACCSVISTICIFILPEKQLPDTVANGEIYNTKKFGEDLFFLYNP